MLAGFLTVLKIICIALLVILAIVLILALLILFVPVRYRAKVFVPETEFESLNDIDISSICAKASFSWLLHILSGGIDYPNDKEFTVRVFGIKVFPRKKKKDKDSETEADTNIDDNTEISFEEKSEMGEPEVKKADETGTVNDESPDLESNVSNCADNSENSHKDKALIEIITDIFEKIENILKTPQTVLKKIQYTISRVCDKMSMIKTTLENDIFKRAFALVKKQLIRMIKMILPDKMDAKILFGTGDPADTAGVVAFYSALYPVLYKKVFFTPDFDRRVVSADASIKGHITGFTILYCVLVCYFNKDVKKVIKRVKKIINS